jgi:hypothetical protein
LSWFGDRIRTDVGISVCLTQGKGFVHETVHGPLFQAE